ncbi:MAG: hypothetical protein AABW56_05520, partial [Nanoarchaeota archaeon]
SVRTSDPILSDKNNSFKELRASQILSSAENAIELLDSNPELESNIHNFISSLETLGTKRTQKFDTILSNLKNLYGTKDSTGLIEKTRKDINSHIEKILSMALRGRDPFIENDIRVSSRLSSDDLKKKIKDRIKFLGKEISSLENQLIKTKNIKQQIEIKNKLEVLKNSNILTADNGKSYVSLAKLLVHFVVFPIINTTNRFEEIQLYFYPLNDSAGLAGADDKNNTGINLASFLIDTSDFITAYSKYSRAKGTSDTTIAEFIGFVTENFIDDPRSYMYGIQEKYEPRDIYNPTKAPKLKESKSKFESERKVLQNELESILDGKEFMLPNVTYKIDTIPSDKKPILRIHIFDEHATPYKNQNELISSMRDTELVDKELLELMGEIVADSVITENKQNLEEHVSKLITADGIRDFFHKTMPSITYGSNNSIIHDMSLTSIQDQQMATVFMMRSGQSSPLTPKGVNEGSIPLRIMPTILEATMLGCPTLEFGQQFFVDFQTNTTADDIYTIIEISHDISPGN